MKALIHSVLKKFLQFILILAIAFAGGSVLMEETSEKTEKNEQAEEAIHSYFHSKGFTQITSKKRWSSTAFQAIANDNIPSKDAIENTEDFNINHIYFASFLSHHI